MAVCPWDWSATREGELYGFWEEFRRKGEMEMRRDGERKLSRPKRSCARNSWLASAWPMGVHMTCRNRLQKNAKRQNMYKQAKTIKSSPCWVAGPICLIWAVCVALFACVNTKLVLGVGSRRAQSQPASRKPTQRGEVIFWGSHTCLDVGVGLGDHCFLIQTCEGWGSLLFVLLALAC